MHLETTRLTLREICADDLPALRAILQDPRTMAAYEGPFDDAGVQEWLDRNLERYRADGFGLWAVELRETGDVVGQCGLTWQEIDGARVLEVGYLFNRAFWHLGLATEAARACVEHAFAALGAERVYAQVRDTNLASMNVAIRLGMTVRSRFVKHYCGVDMPHLAYALDRVDRARRSGSGARAAFAEASAWVASLLDDVPQDRWSGPGLGEWDLRALAGHTSRALLTVEHYLGATAAVPTVASASDYFVRVAAAPGADPAEVHARGVAAGAALGADPAAEFASIAGRVVRAVSAAGDPVFTCLVGAIRLVDYLPTRTFELVVHGIDVARATGRDPEPPAGALREASALAAELAVSRGDGPRLLEALTGRGALGPGFSVLG